MDRYPPSLQPWGGSANPPEPLDHGNTRPSNGLGTSAHGSNLSGPPPHQPLHNPVIHQVCAEVKPRLNKEQHDILERHFQQQPKPSTATKKGFADVLGVPLDKVNNWFQNRRAKVKQDLKKQQNAIAMLHAATGIAMNGHHTFLPVPQPLPSSDPADFYPLHDDLSTQYSAGSSESPVQHGLPFTSGDNFTGITGMVPTIMETTQAGSQEGIVHNLQHAGYAVQQPQFSGPEGAAHFFPTDIFADQGFQMTNNFSDPFGEIPPDMTEPFHSYNIPVQSIEGALPLQAIPSSASHAPSIASTYSHQSVFTDESTRATTAATSSSPCDATDTSAFDAAQQTWETQTPAIHINPSAPELIGSSDSDETPVEANSASLEVSADAFARRNSSTSGLADSMSAVDIAVSSGEAEFRTPDAPSSLAARRQRPRPAALGPASLRSASYSAGMPASPGANQNLAAPDQALRRIRSSGIANPSRVQKPAFSSGQRSPSALAFADAVASPKWNRMSSSSYGSTFVTSPGLASSIAPPTPNTPGELTNFPVWQTPGPKVYDPSSDFTDVSSVAASYTESVSGAGMVAFSSPPTTPLDPEQHAQYRTLMHLQQQAAFHDTPPQSAPASQLAFAFPPTQQMPPTLRINGEKLGHARQTSLPGGAHNFAVTSQQWSMPMFATTGGDWTINAPMQATANGLNDPMVQRVQFSNPFSSAPEQQSGMKTDFSVHLYNPPHASGIVGPETRRDSGPKVYHFTNQGPKDFKGQT